MATEDLLGRLGALLDRLEAILGHLGTVLDGLGVSWSALGPSWSPLGALLLKMYVFPSEFDDMCRFYRCARRKLAITFRLRAPPPSPGPLPRGLKPQRKTSSLVPRSFRYLSDAVLEPSWTPLGDTWGRLGRILGRLGRHWGRLGRKPGH